MRLHSRRSCLALLGTIAFAVVSISLATQAGIPFDTSYRVACATMCLVFIFKLGSDYPESRWPRISFWIAFAVNIGLFFTPLVDRQASRGEVMLFALPDAIIVLVALIISYPVLDEHQRAMRQQMVLGLVVAVAFCALLFALTLMGPHAAH